MDGQNTVNTPTTPKHSFKNIIILLFFAFIIIIISSFTTYYYLSSKSVQQSEPVQQVLVPTIRPTIITDETANWKTYNNKLGFSLKYPTALEVKSSKDYLIINDPQIIEKTIKTEGCAGRNKLRIEMYIEESSEISLQRIIDKRINDPTYHLTNSKIIKLDGVDAMRANYILNTCVDSENVLILFKGYLIEISKYPLNSQDDTFDQILSTFKFQENNTNTQSSTISPTLNIRVNKSTNCTRLESSLNQIINSPDPVKFASQHRIIYKDGQVKVILVFKTGIKKEDLIKQYKFQIDSQYENLIETFIPLSNLCLLSNDSRVKYIGPPTPSDPQ